MRCLRRMPMSAEASPHRAATTSRKMSRRRSACVLRTKERPLGRISTTYVFSPLAVGADDVEIAVLRQGKEGAFEPKFVALAAHDRQHLGGRCKKTRLPRRKREKRAHYFIFSSVQRRVPHSHPMTRTMTAASRAARNPPAKAPAKAIRALCRRRIRSARSRSRA